MPSSMRSRRTGSLSQEGPMVQMILARRFGDAAMFSAKPPETRSSLPCFKICVRSGKGMKQDRYLVSKPGRAISTSSRPKVVRGKIMALNSAPTRITSEIMYIQTSSAMPTPSDP